MKVISIIFPKNVAGLQIELANDKLKSVDQITNLLSLTEVDTT